MTFSERKATSPHAKQPPHAHITSLESICTDAREDAQEGFFSKIRQNLQIDKS